MSKHLKILLGGSPCTHWSIAQSKNRETEALRDKNGLSDRQVLSIARNEYTLEEIQNLGIQEV